jgi:transposase InsO family protein
VLYLPALRILSESKTVSKPLTISEAPTKGCVFTPGQSILSKYRQVLASRSSKSKCCLRMPSLGKQLARRRFPHFGPKKIKAWLERDALKVDWPAASTIGNILKREGLVEGRRRRRRAIAQGDVISPATAANEEWSIDFKGWFRTADGTRCDPLTLTDAASRYLVDVRIVEPTWAGVRGAMERIFGTVDLPRSDPLRQRIAVRFDGRRRALGIVGVVAEARHRATLHPPSSPQDNGRHERMNRTLKAETSKPAAATPAE